MCIYSFMQKKYREVKQESNKVVTYRRWGRNGMEIMGKWERGSRREQHFFEYTCLYTSYS